MNRKLLCRIVTNCYHSFIPEDTLGDEIELIRACKMSHNVVLDKMMIFHEKIIDLNGCIPFEEITNYLYEITHINLKDYHEYFDISKLYTKEDYLEIISILIKSRYLNNYKTLFIESIINPLYYKQNKLMLLFRQSAINGLSNNLEIIKQKISEILEATNYYLKKKKQFSINEIKDYISIFYEKYSKILNIDKIYLFGSCAKQTNDDYSDVDLLIFYKGHKMNINLNNLIIQNWLLDEYEMNVDAVPIIEENGLDTFDKEVMSYAIRLI